MQASRLTLLVSLRMSTSFVHYPNLQFRAIQCLKVQFYLGRIQTCFRKKQTRKSRSKIDIGIVRKVEVKIVPFGIVNLTWNLALRSGSSQQGSARRASHASNWVTSAQFISPFELTSFQVTIKFSRIFHGPKTTVTDSNYPLVR